jgi:hypothetical protein
MHGYLSDAMVCGETEKALQFSVLIENYNGKLIDWTLWLPKSVYNKMEVMECVNGEKARKVNNFVLKLWQGRLPAGAKEIR